MAKLEKRLIFKVGKNRNPVRVKMCFRNIYMVKILENKFKISKINFKMLMKRFKD